MSVKDVLRGAACHEAQLFVRGSPTSCRAYVRSLTKFDVLGSFVLRSDVVGAAVIGCDSCENTLVRRTVTCGEYRT